MGYPSDGVHRGMMICNLDPSQGFFFLFLEEGEEAEEEDGGMWPSNDLQS